LSKVKKDLLNFFKRLSYRLNGQRKNWIKYVAVPEKQERGAWHFHIVTFNLDYIDSKLLAEIWGHGFIKINAVDDVKDLGCYVSKYLTKQVVMFFQGKRYLCSKGLLRPKVYLEDKKKKALIRESIGVKEVFSVDFEIDIREYFKEKVKYSLCY